MNAVAEAWKGRQEREALINTMGHLRWLLTHEISKAASGGEPHAAADAVRLPQGATLRALSTRDMEATFGGVTVRRVPNNLPPSPFWVASATPDVVDGHNGIFQPIFIGFCTRPRCRPHKERAPYYGSRTGQAICTRY